MKLQITKLDDDAKIPTRAYETDAGLDLYCLEDVTVKPKFRLIPKLDQVKCDKSDCGTDLVESKFVLAESPTIANTGIAIKIPRGYYGRIAEKSGLASRGISIGGGVIDESFVGEILVIVNNHHWEPITFEKGQKIAQLIIQPCVQPEIEVVDSLGETDRGDSGFGSSGS